MQNKRHNIEKKYVEWQKFRSSSEFFQLFPAISDTFWISSMKSRVRFSFERFLWMRWNDENGGFVISARVVNRLLHHRHSHVSVAPMHWTITRCVCQSLVLRSTKGCWDKKERICYRFERESVWLKFKKICSVGGVMPGTDRCVRPQLAHTKVRATLTIASTLQQSDMHQILFALELVFGYRKDRAVCFQ